LDQLRKVLDYDPVIDMSKELDRESPAAKIIFARQEYSIKFGSALGLKEDFYLYLSAPDEFLKGAEKRFASEFKTIKRAEPGEESAIIDDVNEEKNRAATGFGSIFK
jgi:hypothetical protein